MTTNSKTKILDSPSFIKNKVALKQISIPTIQNTFYKKI